MTPSETASTAGLVTDMAGLRETAKGSELPALVAECLIRHYA